MKHNVHSHSEYISDALCWVFIYDFLNAVSTHRESKMAATENAVPQLLHAVTLSTRIYGMSIRNHCSSNLGFKMIDTLGAGFLSAVSENPNAFLDGEGYERDLREVCQEIIDNAIDKIDTMEEINPLPVCDDNLNDEIVLAWFSEFSKESGMADAYKAIKKGVPRQDVFA